MASSEREPLPQRLGDFDIVGELGRGGMGVVYEARQRSLNRRVALKVLASSLGLSPRAIERFQREAEAAAKLHHTNIIPIYATGQQDGVHYYVMEMIDGPSLDRVLRALRQTTRGASVDAATQAETAMPGWVGNSLAYAQTLQPASASGSGSGSGSLGTGSAYYDTVASMIAAVADALEHAHQHGVIHRDIKPANLLLSADGKLSLNDFGLARVLEQPGMTQTGEFVGTPAYMSPEQITAGRVPLDHRTDIYSLGATLYEMLTLQPPFQAERRDQMLAQILHKEPAAPRTLQKQVPLDLETICLKALDKDPDRRYQHARDLADDLRRYVNRFAIHARRAGPIEKLWKWARRRPGLASALACLLVASASTGYFAYRFAESERSAEEDRQKFVAAQQRKELQAALQHATELGLRGKFAQADAALEEARQLGAPPGEILQRRGMLALLRGQSGDAIAQLEQAVAQLPRRMTPLLMLVRAYHEAGQFDIFYSKRWAPLAEMKPESAEDYLFLGQLLASFNPERSLPYLDKAIEHGDFALPRLVRAEVRTRYAEMTGKVVDAERAREDVKVARSLLPAAPQVLLASLEANLGAACAYERTRQLDKQAAMLAACAEDVRDLQTTVLVPKALRLCLLYYDYANNTDAIHAAYRQEVPVNGGTVSGRTMFHLLYREGKFVDALNVLERMPHAGNEVMYHMRRGLVVAELADGEKRALAEYATGVAVASGSGKYPGGRVGYMRQILAVLGRKEEIVALARKDIADRQHIPEPRGFRWYEVFANEPHDWHQKCTECRAEVISADELLAIAGSSLLRQCEAHFYIGSYALATGNRRDARQHFEASVATRVLSYLEYEWSRSYLAQLDRDPAWPRRIPLVK